MKIVYRGNKKGKVRKSKRIVMKTKARRAKIKRIRIMKATNKMKKMNKIN